MNEYEIEQFLEEMGIASFQADWTGGRGSGYILEEFSEKQVGPERLDDLLAAGWRHFGTNFFRYDRTIHDGAIQKVLPLRIRLPKFALSKSQRRVVRKNEDVETEMGPAAVTAESVELFEKHKLRFTEGRPPSIFTYLCPDEPGSVPCKVMEMKFRLDGTLIADCFFDVGSNSISSIYATFDPDLSDRSLGIFTMLQEIAWAADSGREFYYQGYAFQGPSFYDYKKRFRGVEYYDWKGSWLSI